MTNVQLQAEICLKDAINERLQAKYNICKDMAIKAMENESKAKQDLIETKQDLTQQIIDLKYELELSKIRYERDLKDMKALQKQTKYERGMARLHKDLEGATWDN